MATRTAGGRVGAVSRTMLFVSLALVASMEVAHAQQFAPRSGYAVKEIRFQPTSQPPTADISGSWNSDSESYGSPSRGMDTYDDYGYGIYGNGDVTCGCPSDSFDDFSGCTPNTTKWWFAAEYLLWKTDSTHLPALVTDSPIGTIPELGSSSTQILSAQKVAESWRSGYRLEMGIWLDDCETLAVVGDYFNIGEDDYDYYFPGDSGRNTGRPYFNTQLGAQTVLPISGTYFDPMNPMVPIVRDGTISITVDDEFQGSGLTLEQCVYSVGDSSGRGPSTQVIILGGYRFYGYSSRLAIADSTTILSGAGAVSYDTRRDVFTSNNKFNGGEIGAKVRFTQTGCWFDGMFKLALGGHYRKVTINGVTASIPAGGALQVSEGGLYTSEDTNIGTYSDSRARLIPEFRIGVGVYLTPNWTMRASYSAIVWSGVVRAADGLPPNLAVDRRNTPGGTGNGGVSPVFSGLGGSELVANGLDLGFEYNY